MQKIFLIVIIVVFNELCLSAQFQYSNNVGKAHNAILNLNFEEADVIIESFSSIEQGMRYWLHSYKLFVEYKITSKNQELDSILSLCKNYKDSTNELRQTAPFYYYCLADINFVIGALYLEKKEYLNALQYYAAAKAEVNKYKKRFPVFEKGYKHQLIEMSFNNMLYRQLGLINDYSKAEYFELIDEANREQTEDSVIRRELKLLCVILKDFQLISEKELEKASVVDLKYANKGPLESLVCLMEYRKQKKITEVGLVLHEAYEKGYNEKINAFNLWKGDYLLSQLQDSSIVYLEVFLNKQKSNKLLNYARFKASMYYYISNNKGKSDSIIEQIALSNQALTSEDEQAVYEAGGAVYWLPELLKARLLFDGGLYDEALNVLLISKNNISKYSKEQKLEYSYRMGRIYHLKNDIEKAKVFYNMVINSGKDHEFYYPAYAAYYLGEMYKYTGNKEKAFYYFALCKELDSPIYKLSIHKKAEQQLKQ